MQNDGAVSPLILSWSLLGQRTGKKWKKWPIDTKDVRFLNTNSRITLLATCLESTYIHYVHAMWVYLGVYKWKRATKTSTWMSSNAWVANIAWLSYVISQLQRWRRIQRLYCSYCSFGAGPFSFPVGASFVAYKTCGLVFSFQLVPTQRNWEHRSLNKFLNLKEIDKKPKALAPEHSEIYWSSSSSTRCTTTGCTTTGCTTSTGCTGSIPRRPWYTVVVPGYRITGTVSWYSNVYDLYVYLELYIQEDFYGRQRAITQFALA